jgi:hypothetical protein
MGFSPLGLTRADAENENALCPSGDAHCFPVRCENRVGGLHWTLVRSA